MSSRLYRYSDGLAQLVGGDPEPRVARWADVRDITVDYHKPEDLPPRLNGFTLTTSSGTELPGISGQTHIDPKDGAYASEIIVGREGQPDDEPTVEIPLVLLPNGIFLPALLSHAARRHGVTVTGYRGDGGSVARA